MSKSSSYDKKDIEGINDDFFTLDTWPSSPLINPYPSKHRKFRNIRKESSGNRVGNQAQKNYQNVKKQKIVHPKCSTSSQFNCSSSVDHHQTDNDIVYEGTYTKNSYSIQACSASHTNQKRYILPNACPTINIKRHCSSVVSSQDGMKKKDKRKGKVLSTLHTADHQDSEANIKMISSTDEVETVILDSSDSDIVVEDYVVSDMERIDKKDSTNKSPTHLSSEDDLHEDVLCSNSNVIPKESSVIETDCRSKQNTSPSNTNCDDPPINIDNENFVSLQQVHLSDIEYDIYISEEVKAARYALESTRRWDLTGLGKDILNTERRIPGLVFNILSYNVLAQDLIWNNMHLYRNCKSEHLDWYYRWNLLQHEIRHLQPDIMALQEVQSSHYHTHFLPWFANLGYQCLFKKRTGNKGDGCALVFNVKKFRLIESNSVEFNQPRAGPILNRDNVGLVAKLSPIDFDQPFCVATTHILFNPRRVEIKLAQMVVLLAELDRISYKGEHGGKSLFCPVILTGDFNAEPLSNLLKLVRGFNINCNELKSLLISLGISENCQHNSLLQDRYMGQLRGELFSLVDQRKIQENLIKLYHSERKNSNTERNACENESNFSTQFPTSIRMQHSFNFKSAYWLPSNYQDSDRLGVSTYQDRWVNVDFIFYSCNISSTHKLVEGDLKLLARYNLLDKTAAQLNGSLPSAICPSDHFPLAAQYLLQPPSNKR